MKLASRPANQDATVDLVRSEKLLALLTSGRGLRILVSSAMPDWQEHIASGFSRTRHTVEFGEMTRQNAVLNRAISAAGSGRYIPKTGNSGELAPPCILKKRVGECGKNCTMVLKRQDEEAVLDALRDPEFFCQKIITGKFECATHILFVNNRIVKSLNIMYAFDSEFPIKGDLNVYRVIHRCPYLKLFRRILETIGFHGLCCLNYKVADAQPYLLEINPRCGGSPGPFFFSFVRHLR